MKDEYEVQKNVEDMALEDIKDKVENDKTKNLIKGKEVEDMGKKEIDNKVFAKAIAGKEITAEEKPIVKNMMSEGDATKGGLTVPKDIQTKIIELQRNQFDIRPYVNVEPVSTMSGSRNIEDEEPEEAGFASVDEGAAIQALHEPKFKELDYQVRKYAGLIPLTNELLEDTAENILAYIEKWMAKNELNTYNYQVFNGSGTKAAQGIMTLTNLQENVDLSGTTKTIMKAFKHIFDKELENVSSDNIKIFTNGDGYEFLDELEDAEGHSYLQPDATLASGYRFLGHELVKVPTKFLANVTTGTGDTAVTRIPFIIGDLKALYTVFDRQQMSVATTNVGAGAFENDNTQCKGIFRFDGKTADTGSTKILMAKIA